MPPDSDYAASGADAGTSPAIIARRAFSAYIQRYAARELMYELSEYLSRRYPKSFSVTRHPLEKGGEGGWYGEGRIHTITILPVNTTYDLDVDDPMTVSGLLYVVSHFVLARVLSQMLAPFPMSACRTTWL